MLKELKVKIIGVVENMKSNKTKLIQTKTEKLGVKFLGIIPYDEKLEDTIGNYDKLLATNFSNKVHETLGKEFL